MSPPGTERGPLLRLRVTADAERVLRGGHPWLFAESIREQNRPGVTGEVAVVYGRQNRFVALGLFDGGSPIRFRSLQLKSPQTLNRDWWGKRLTAAWQRRLPWFDSATNGYRCVHGESDGWPGLVLDRYDRTFVLKLYTAAWFPRLPEIAGLIVEQLEPERLVLRLSRNVQSAAAAFQLSDGQVLWGTPPDGPVTFLESGLRFESDVVKGQKTGFFLDQRENRRAVGELARGRRVLNAFSFSGGFSLYAARAGAVATTDLDLSEHALAAARRNFKWNASEPSIASCRHELIQADAFDWLGDQKRARFDLIVLDPPALAKREAQRAGALAAYHRLVVLAAKALLPNGVLVACSCSAQVGAPEFFDCVRQAMTTAARKWTELRTTRQPADHPATFKEAEYLKAIYLRAD